jgi:hypothetical protein
MADADLVIVVIEFDALFRRYVDEGEDRRKGAIGWKNLYLNGCLMLKMDMNTISAVVEASSGFFSRDRMQIAISALNEGNDMKLGDHIIGVLQSLT